MSPVYDPRALAEAAPYPKRTGTEPCAKGDPDRFFPDSVRTRTGHIQAECGPCPIREECLAYALTHAVAGIWGGTTEEQRREIQQGRNIAVVALHPPLDREMVIAAHRRGTPLEVIARLCGVSVDTVRLVIGRHQRRQRDQASYARRKAQEASYARRKAQEASVS